MNDLKKTILFFIAFLFFPLTGGIWFETNKTPTFLMIFIGLIIFYSILYSSIFLLTLKLKFGKIIFKSYHITIICSILVSFVFLYSDKIFQSFFKDKQNIFYEISWLYPMVSFFLFIKLFSIIVKNK